MAQAGGYGNTAPNPIPGSFGNPTGANVGLPNVNLSGLPGAYGAPGQGGIAGQGSTIPQSFFPANTGGTNTALPAGLAGLSSGMFGPTSQGGNWYQNLYNELGRAYGKGTGQVLGNILSQGLFNPQVAQNLMNAMEPTIQRGYQDILSSFSGAGARFSSAAGIGAGDYMSQARLGQTAQLSNLFQQDQMAQLGLLQDVLPTLHAEEANRGGVLKDILGGLETVAGAALLPFSGGLSGGLISGGLSTLFGKKNQPAQFSGGSVGGVSDPSLATPSYMPTTAPSNIATPAGGIDLSTILGMSAGADLGGAAMPTSSATFPLSF